MDQRTREDQITMISHVGWVLWLKRNERQFRGKQSNPKEIATLIQRLITKILEAKEDFAGPMRPWQWGISGLVTSPSSS